jgi:sulfide dehydrogenase cytochrome subunit
MPNIHRTYLIPSFKTTVKISQKIILSGVLALSIFSSAVHAEGISKIDIIVSTCFTCHGVDGVGSGKIPELRDLKKSDITESLLGFASGDEKSTIMGRHAKAYTKDEINQLAEYFAGLKK